ncbi:heme-binding protein 2-like [Dendronephthya gigantea]|uniref:heme-binding protein 2-like n=1 Tax=Dendronephthya gigantea TaxID=151771 RepID=UPI00106AB360|nr:heme-binding protein 2-like [Dendronephthya gigantea]
MKQSILFAFLLVLVLANAYPTNSVNSSRSSSKSWFWSLSKVVTSLGKKLWYWDDKCHDLDCPKYETKKTTDDYELRCYPNYSWVGTVYEGKELTSDVRKDMFMRLFHYIQGENVEKVKIEMTVPVASKVESMSDKTRWTMLFFVPFKYQTSPPQPTDPQVAIVRLPKICVYVKSFNWYTDTKRVEMKVKELEEALKKDKITDYVDPDTAYIYGGYDNPWTLPFLRHNEVWILQK